MNHQQQAPTSQVSELVARQVAGDVIDFSVGQPSPCLLPLDKISAAASHRLDPSCQSPLLLQYAPRPGYQSFRVTLAQFLSSQYGYDVDPDGLVITAGVSHGIDLVCGNLTRPGDVVVVESPTYFLAQRILDQNHVAVKPIRSDEHGMDVEALATWLAESSDHRPRLVYTIPVYNNPSGATLSAERRAQLLALAEQYDFRVVADEVYQLLHFEGTPAPPPPMRQLEGSVRSSEASRVMSLGSFSKIMAPGLRLGWVECNPALAARLKEDGVLNSGGCIAPLSAGIAHSALELGLLQQHLQGAVRPKLAERCATLCTALRRQLEPLGCSFSQPQGGYFVWLNLPEEVQAAELMAYAVAEHGVRFLPGTSCGKEGCSSAVRLSFAFYTAPELEQGVARLGKALRAFLETRAGQAGTPPCPPLEPYGAVV